MGKLIAKILIIVIMERSYSEELRMEEIE